MAVAAVWKRNCQKEEKILRSAQDYEKRLGSGEFDNGWDLVAPSNKSPRTS